MSQNHIIKIYSTPTCPYCGTLKQFFKDRGFEFEDIDVSKDNTAIDYMVEKSGQMGVPVVEIDDNFVIGFDRAKIVELLNIKE